MSSEPLVSIITPTYNHEKYIAQCIRSVIQQTYQDWEMLIIDDGSTDRTSDIIRSFLDNRIKYIRQEHLGPYQLKTTYNKALFQARGELIAILEGDDFWPPDKLAVQTPYFSEQGVVLTYGDCILTDEKATSLFYRKVPTVPGGTRQATLQMLLKGENFIYAQTVMLRRDVLLKIGGFIQPDYLHLVDYPTWARLSLEGEFKAIAHPLGYWRRNIKSTTFGGSPAHLEGLSRYIIEFSRVHLEQIHNLGITISPEQLEKEHSQKLKHSRLHQDYTRGIIAMVYGYNRAANKYLHFYLRQRNKGLFYGVIALIGLLLSPLNLPKLLLPYLGIPLSRFFDWLKRVLM